MNKPFTAKDVVSGTYVDVWVDSVRHYELVSIQAKITVNKEEIPRAGEFMIDHKATNGKGTGSIELYKTDSSNLTDYIKLENPNERHEIVFKVDDPDVAGAEHIRLTGVSFDDLTLADYSLQASAKVTLPFTFTGFKPLQKMEAAI